MKKKQINVLINILFLFLFMSGCLELFNPMTNGNTITFQAHPTTIEYTLSYGYQIESTGNGEATLHYQEDFPELAAGTITNLSVLQEKQSNIITIANNDMAVWNLSIKDNQKFTLGITAEILAESFLIADLNGSDALSINTLSSTYPSLINTYCQPQGNDTHWLIQPDHFLIKETAYEIISNSTSSNSFEIAKEIFHWLKKQTSYQIHPNQESTQPAIETLQKKTGDCDDLSFLYLSLLRAVQIPSRFVKGYLITEENGSIQAISHLWVEVYVGGNIGQNGWIPVECAGTGDTDYEIYQNFGIEDASHLRLFVDDGSNISLIQSNRHISIQYPEGMQITLTNYATVTKYNIINSEKLCIKNNQRSYC